MQNVADCRGTKFRSLKVEPYTVLPNIAAEPSLPVHGAVEGKYRDKGTKVTLLVPGCGKARLNA
jgi:hypothetical protein